MMEEAVGAHDALEIRGFGWSDYSEVAHLWRVGGREALPVEELRVTLDHGPGLMVVAAYADVGIVGVVLGTFDGRRGWIHRLAVHPAHRRKGLATAMVAELERRLISQGASRVNLLVMPDNAETLIFWQRLGYDLRPDVLCTKQMRNVTEPRS